MRRVRRIFGDALRKTGLRPVLTWLRHRGLRPSDVYIASYPRSGNTWLRFLLYEIISGQPAEFANVRGAIPDVGRQRGAPALVSDGGRLIKTHEPYRQTYRRAIYLVRDPRDVVLSEHAYQQLWGLYSGDLDSFLQEFLAGDRNLFGRWADHVTSWLDGELAGSDRLLVVKYEEMRQDPQQALEQIVGFLGLSISPEEIQTAIANNSLRRMREKEDKARQTIFKEIKGDLRFVNKGSVGGWRERLDEQQVALIERHLGAMLERLDYPRR